MPTSEFDTLPRTVARRVRTLGHALGRLQAGMDLLQTRLERKMLDGVSTAWIREWTHLALADQPRIQSPLTATIAWSTENRVWRVIELPKPWHGALMLLHLPALKSFWRKELRAARFALLQRVLPRVWAKDETMLPPGAVIAGLGLTSWADLSRLQESGRRFVEIPLAERKTLVLEAQVHDASHTLRVMWESGDNGRIDFV